EPDNKITWDAQRGCLLFEAQHSEIAAVQGFRPASNRVEHQRMLVFDKSLGAGEEAEFAFLVAIAGDGQSALQLYDNLQSRFAELEQENGATFNRLVRAAFTPGN